MRSGRPKSDSKPSTDFKNILFVLRIRGFWFDERLRLRFKWLFSSHDEMKNNRMCLMQFPFHLSITFLSLSLTSFSSLWARWFGIAKWLMLIDLSIRIIYICFDREWLWQKAEKNLINATMFAFHINAWRRSFRNYLVNNRRRDSSWAISIHNFSRSINDYWINLIRNQLRLPTDRHSVLNSFEKIDNGEKVASCFIIRAHYVEMMKRCLLSKQKNGIVVWKQHRTASRKERERDKRSFSSSRDITKLLICERKKNVRKANFHSSRLGGKLWMWETERMKTTSILLFEKTKKKMFESIKAYFWIVNQFYQ